MTTNEDLLDQLYDLQQKRLSEIYNKGESFHTNGMEATHKGLYDQQKSTVTFAAPCQIAAGSVLTGAYGSLYVSGVSTKAGVVVLEVLPVLGELEVMTSTKHGYHRTGSLPILSRVGGNLGVPAYGAPLQGSVIKTAGQLLKVAAVCRSGAVTLLTLGALPAEKTLDQKQGGGYRGGITGLPETTSMFWR